MRSALLTFLLFLSLHAARGEPLWRTLPPTPAPVPGEHIGHAKVNGISLYYATIGRRDHRAEGRPASQLGLLGAPIPWACCPWSSIARQT
jgi:hypothetical protein